MIGAIGGMSIGSVLPWLWGDYDGFGIASALWGMIGGFVGIVVAVWLGRFFD